MELHRQVDAIQMGTHYICLYKADKKYTGCNLKTTELLDYELIGACVVIRSNTVLLNYNVCIYFISLASILHNFWFGELSR